MNLKITGLRLGILILFLLMFSIELIPGSATLRSAYLVGGETVYAYYYYNFISLEAFGMGYITGLPIALLTLLSTILYVLYLRNNHLNTLNLVRLLTFLISLLCILNLMFFVKDFFTITLCVLPIVIYGLIRLLYYIKMKDIKDFYESHQKTI
ncbi:hypothetical protein [Acholeplasma hippikon]|uniref:Uncharacterized protein n=1 Tax=Acholeplasma hippikon TaxID=264636 RepID=A0A449BJW8_9MOLU|nr:hypothetical protein [Acholeplasma hippikon]VEU82744.1 Uncharacterised protein [Acholeplasma hippikon]